MKKSVLILSTSAFIATSAQAVDYVWDNGGVDDSWYTAENWDPDGVKPPASGGGAAGDTITFQGGNVKGTVTGTDNVIVGDVTWQNNFAWNDMGDWSTSGDGITVDTGSAADAIWQSNGNTMTFNYTNFTLNSNLVLTGGGRINVEPGRYLEDGVDGDNNPVSRGIIVEDGTLNFQGIHQVRSGHTFTGGIEIKPAGAVSFGGGPGNYRNSDLGDGLITIHEGGSLAAHDSVLDQNVEFVVTSAGSTDGSTDPFITGGGGSLNFTGEFSFDLTGAGTTSGNYWPIVTATATYDPVEFSVTGFTESSPGVWTANVSGTDYSFDESTGILDVTSGGGGVTYATWSGGAAADADANSDGVANGLAFVLGAADVNENAVGLLPTSDDSDPDYFIFNFRRDDDAEADPKTTITAQYGTDLATWTDAVDPNPGTSGDDVDTIVHDDDYATGVDRVEVRLHRANLSVGSKLLARLQVVVTP